MGYSTILVYMTATVHGPDEYETFGWVDPGQSRLELYDNRNDVDTLVQVDTDIDGGLPLVAQEELFDEVHEHLGDYRDNGDGTYYAVDRYQDPDTGKWWHYALHITRKYYGPNGYAEVPYRPQVLTHQQYPHHPGALSGCYACDYINERLEA